MGLAGVLCWQRLASQDVLSEGDRFQVDRVDAEPDPAEMVEGEVVWYRADEKLVGETVGESSRLAVAAISRFVLGPSPQPTAGRGTLEPGPDDFSKIGFG